MSRASQLFLGICFLLLTITWIIPELGLWEHSSGYYTFSVFVSLIVVGIAVVAYVNAWADKKRNEQVIRRKISEIEKKFALHSELTSELSSKDLSSLRIYKVIILLVGCGLGLVVLAVILVMSLQALVKLAVAGGIVLIFFAILLAINKRMDLMFEFEGKTILRGIVSKKDIGVDDANDKAYHWLYIGDRKVKVEMELYLRYDIGNAVEFHLYERFGTFILHHEKLEGAGIEAD